MNRDESVRFATKYLEDYYLSSELTSQSGRLLMTKLFN